MFSKWLRGAAVLSAFLLSTAGAAFGQFNSNVQGTVTDSTGAVVPAAPVTLHNKQTGVDNQSKTDSAGFYRFSGIATGDYVVIVEAKGFDRTEVPFKLGAQETQGVNVTLKVQSSATTVTVTENYTGINPDETRLVQTISGTQLPDLPLPQRATVGILDLAPGAVNTNPAGRSENTNLPIGSNQPSISANGRPSSGNLYRLDGIPIMSAQTFGNINLIPAPDMIAETTLQTSTFVADTGGTSSLVTDFTSKSGTNTFHGDIDGTYTSRFFQAHPWNSVNSPFTRKWLSGSLGGPIIKNRTFFFGSAETQVVQNVPSAEVSTEETDQFVNWAKGALPNSHLVNQFMVYRPTRVAFQKYTKFASDIYPANATSGPACGQASSDFMPCNLPVFYQGIFSQSPKLNGTQYNTRLDHYFNNGNDRIFLNYFRIDQTSDFLSQRPAMDSSTPSSTWFGAANYVHTFTPSLINQAQFGWTRFHSDFGGQGKNVWIDTPFIMAECCDALGFFGYFPTDIDPGGVNNKDHEYRFRDYVSWVKSRHTIRIGLDVTHEDYWLDNSGFYARPFFPFYGSFWNMLNDNPNSYALYTISAQTGKFIAQTFGAQVTQIGVYAQDEWKLRPNLTLDLGIRWDDYGNPSNYGAHSQPYVGVFPGSPNVSSQAALQQALLNTSYVKFINHPFNGIMQTNIQPRLGLAYTPTKDQKTVIRAGFGIYNDGLDLSTVTANLPTQPPNRLTLNLNKNNPYLQPGKTPWGSSPTYPYGFDYPTITLGAPDSRGAPRDAGGNPIGASLNGLDPNLTPQKTAIWNFGVQRELPSRIVTEIAYTGSYSWNLFYQPDYNLENGVPKRPTQEWGEIKYLRNGFTSNYNALVISARQNLGRLGWVSSYTWSKSLADQFVPGSGNLSSIVYGPTGFDVRQHFSFGGTYQFPTPHNWFLKEVGGGWTIGSIVIAQTGLPFTVLDPNDNRNDGQGCSPCNLPDLTPGTQTSGFSKQQYINGLFPNTSAVFLSPPKNTQGNEGINAFRNPGYFGWDASAIKKFALPWFHDQTSTFTLRAEALNILNKTNLLGVQTATLQQNNFAQSTGAATPRTFQLGARFEF